MQAAPRFELFGVVHLTTLLIILVISAGLPLVARKAGAVPEQRVAMVLALLLIGQEASRLWLGLRAAGSFTPELLPVHLCTAAVYLSAWMLLRRSRGVYEVVYFWGLGGTTQALLTPDLQHGFPHPAFLRFFLGHGLIIVAVVYATVVFRFRPYLKSIPKVAFITLAYAAGAALVNALWGTNFLYLSGKPAQASLLDYFGPWPWYLIGLFGAALVSFVIWYAPFLIWDVSRRHRRATTKPTPS